MRKDIDEAVTQLVGDTLTEMNDVVQYVLQGLKNATGLQFKVSKRSGTYGDLPPTYDGKADPQSGTNWQIYTVVAYAKGVMLGYTTVSFSMGGDILFGTRSGVFMSEGMEAVMKQLERDAAKYLGVSSNMRGMKGGSYGRDRSKWHDELDRRTALKRTRSGN